MKNTFKIILSYLLISFNTYVCSVENKNENLLKIGILAPFSGEFKDLGEAVLYSVNLALHDIGDESIKIYPKDSGSNKEKILKSCEEFRSEGIKIIIGPIDSEFINELNNFDSFFLKFFTRLNYFFFIRTRIFWINFNCIVINIM